MSTRKFGGRTLARSQALQLLFQAEVTDRSVADVLAGPYALGQDDPLDEFGEELALGADGMRVALDAVIAQASKNWTVGRMPSVDRNLLRLAIYEMLEVDEVAIAVTIDESVELAKAFGTDESSRFVNGLLGRVATQIEEGCDVVDMALRRLEEQERAAREAQERAAAEAAAAEAAEAEAKEGAEAEAAEAAEAAEVADKTAPVADQDAETGE